MKYGPPVAEIQTEYKSVIVMQNDIACSRFWNIDV